MSRLFSYRLSLVLVVGVIAASLLPFSEMPLREVRFADKYTHLLMYFSLSSVLWWECGRRNRQAWLLCFCFPLVLGGVLELLQAHCTTTRSGDWIDFFANGLGVLCALPFSRVLTSSSDKLSHP